ncbi:response regulator [Geomonas subterranea]|uniref:Response regulator transcription factor n=1 Tax=Geomonas subterranea TaxID=2847989 RepID=A0ABX8LJT5_9BACT|nr:MULTISPECIES: response regulator transcription factor [Geomonas]QXE90955.1 response regulator transcription factor [Geomonas subterranea]QXM10958.1 response regulator transcription factor [Geomonas subterranea]
MIRVLLTDDHKILREGLKGLLHDTDDIKVVGEAGDIQELFAQLGAVECDVIVLDISLPGRSGLDALKQLKAEKVETPVLVLSMHPEEQYAIRAIRSGAAGYLTKETASQELVHAIRKVHSGGKYLSSNLAEALFTELANPRGADPHTLLSDREYQIMCMIGSGLTLTGIADKLSLSVKTISTYRSRLLLKMGMKNNAEVTTYVVKNGLLCDKG